MSENASIVIVTNDDSGTYAIYAHGELVASGEMSDQDMFEALVKYTGIRWIDDEDNALYLGDEDMDEPAKHLSEVERYHSLPGYEQEAIDLERQAQRVREQGRRYEERARNLDQAAADRRRSDPLARGF